MDLTFAVTQADLAAWTCLVVGLSLVLTGALTGIASAATGPVSKANEKIEEAKRKVDAADARLTADGSGGVQGRGVVAADTAAASEATTAAKSALEQVQGIVASLPENLRFAGLLVLVGTVLVGVATVEFNGTSLF